MTENNMHDGFENGEVRSFLSQCLFDIEINLSKAHVILSEEKKEIYKDCKRTTLDYAMRALKASEIELKYATEVHKLNKMKMGLLTVIDGKGWSEHDLSDYLENVTYPYLHFIGTEEEANTLKNK